MSPASDEEQSPGSREHIPDRREEVVEPRDHLIRVSLTIRRIAEPVEKSSSLSCSSIILRMDVSLMTPVVVVGV